jgi:DNA-binding NtrC family response regulator
VLPKVLVITNQPMPSDCALVHGCNGVAQCLWQTWDTLRCARLPDGTQLIIAHADPITEMATLFFQTLSATSGPPVLAVLPQSCDRETLELVSGAATDFLFSPLREDELRLRALRLLGTQPAELHELEDKLREELGLTQLVGNHPEFLRAVQQALLFSKSDAPVLITGETGTGKELFAHAIHSLSRRCNGPFIPLDCGTLPEHLAENELFGHRRGAYTDAHCDQKGLAAMADRGTLFLDEIDALSPANQSKFLRFLQEGAYRALGSDSLTRSNIRIIAATNRPIEEAVRERQFRSDLYFRINVLRLDLPPLRKRRGDVSLLARHFLASGSLAGPLTFSSAALLKLESYHWPGNVRELLNTVQRAALGCSGRQILPKHIVLGAGEQTTETSAATGSSFRLAKQAVIERFEKSYVEELLARFQGSVTRAAREAGKERRAFGRLVKKYGISITISSQNSTTGGAGRL